MQTTASCQRRPAVPAFAPSSTPLEGAATPHPRERNELDIHELFERQAAARPDHVAIISDDERLTYAQLNQKANRLAHFLREKGVGHESIVGLCVERSARTVVAILGILKAGGCYLPIDLAYPDERIAFMLADAKVELLITEKKLLSRLRDFRGKVLCLDVDELEWSYYSTLNPPATACSGNAAYIIYTSGSTGTPKGVLIPHHNVVRLFTSTQAWFDFRDTDVWSLFHSFAFDFSVWELWGALFYGGAVVVVPGAVARSPEQFYQLLHRERVTVLSQTPSAFRQLIWAEEAVGTRPDLQLRYIIFGGEALELQSLGPWLGKHGDDRPQLINMYGITETTVHVTYRPIRQKDVTAKAGSVIGVAIPDLALYLLNENLEPVAIGTAGEICVGGDGLARGYLNRPDLTAERFVPNPFSKVPGARLYRSGDLARGIPNDEMEYLGRRDQQVKIRGFRIELGEIEAALNTHPAVRESVVTCDTSSSEKRLVAYMIGEDPSPAPDELREFLARRLPGYMVPARFVFLKSLPLTINGKIDRAALPQPERSRPDLSTRFVSPRTSPERTLAAIWREVLSVDQIGIHDNFFELGGDSIRSIQVLAKAQREGLHFSLQKLFQHPTIAGLISHLETSVEDEVGVEAAPFALLSKEDRARIPAGIEDAYPLTRLQHGMVFHSEYDLRSAIFHDVFSFRLKLPFQEAPLREAVRSLIARHAIFRTSFDLHSYSEPLQLVHARAEAALTIDDLRGYSAEEQKQALIDWVEREKRSRFAWTVAPLMRLHVQRYGADTFQFVVSFHHSIMDGWSLAAMLTELFQEYAGLLHGRPAALAPPRVSYRDFVMLEQQAIASPGMRAFWNEKISDTTRHTLPRWKESPKRGGFDQVRGPEIYFPTDLLARLKQLANESGLPIRSVLLAAHCRVLGCLTGQADIVTGLVVNGRPQRLDGEKLIGLFLNTVPFRVALSGGTWRDLVRQTFEAEQELIPARRYPLAEIQQLAQGHALFETVFDFVQFHVYRDLPGYREHTFLEDHYFEANNFNFYVTFMLDAAAAELQMHFDYNPNEFCEEQIELICGQYLEALRAIAFESDARYESRCLLGPDERERLLVTWNDTQRAASPTSVHEWIEQRAGRTPDATAAIFQKTRLSYRQLNAAANRLAARLRDAGVGPNVPVGIHCERSLEMLVAVLAVLKAGGAYLPLDPSYPRERLRFMAEDSGLQVILTGALRGGSQLLPANELIELEGLIDPPAEDVPNLPPLTDRDDLAYVIYTSGSTGRPKGVQIPHRALTNFLNSMLREPGLHATDTLLAVTTLSFDIAGLELFLPLVAGAKLVIAPTVAAQDPVALRQLLEEHGATVLQATPATWTALVESDWTGSPRLRAFCGGEALSRELADRILSRCQELWNLYGPTETTIWSTVERVAHGTGPIPIGRPINNTKIYILDRWLNPVPQGSLGEIYIGGEGLARGYIKRPELTEERFLPHPFQSGARLYRTGDLGRFLADGRVVCSGRADQQIKLRGFRIEPGEIENVLARYPGVTRALVMASGEEAHKTLVAYWIGAANGPITSDALRAFIEEQLPSYMVPSVFVRLAEFPLTPNGKIDRARLPHPTPEDRAPKKTKVAPRTPFEKELAGVWATLLNVGEIGVYDNFFHLGGNSLLAMRALGKLRNRFDADLTVASFFEHPTIESYAQHLLQAVLARQKIGPLSGARSGR